jgi:hypothetical protein
VDEISIYQLLLGDASLLRTSISGYSSFRVLCLEVEILYVIFRKENGYAGRARAFHEIGRDRDRDRDRGNSIFHASLLDSRVQTSSIRTLATA